MIDSVNFLNTGTDQIPGLIVMHLADTDNRDKNYKEIVVLFNANPGEINFSSGDLNNKVFSLHPVQQASVDSRVQNALFDADTGSFSIPGRTTAVSTISSGEKDRINLIVGNFFKGTIITRLCLFTFFQK